MTYETVDPTRLPVWPALIAHSARLPHLRTLLDEDADRFEACALHPPHMLIDTSRQRWDPPLRIALTELARQAGLEDKRRTLMGANRFNPTEGRAVLHTLLRRATEETVELDGIDVAAEVRAGLERMAELSEAVRGGSWRGMHGHAICDVVNIGIGGSQLGPALLCDVLADGSGPRVHFLANVDGSESARLLGRLDPARTLFIVASKSFGTMETRINADTARRWFIERGGSQADIARHFVAVSTNVEAAAAFGIPEHNLLPMWDWVGGRYSVWSPIGLPVTMAAGFAKFERLLAGARAMDAHFAEAPLEDNAPVQLALAGIWNQNFLSTTSHAVLPYSTPLARLPDYLQQLEMESNGKRVTVDGDDVPIPTGTVLWGGVGTNGQHAFHQLLHQGTEHFSADFVLARRTEPGAPAGHHAWLGAHCLAQAEALARGRDLEEVTRALESEGMAPETARAAAPHRELPGNHPSTTLILDDLGPESLGALLALFEHKVFCQGIIWGINSFDQWGVEQGKLLGDRIHAALASPSPAEAAQAGDATTRALVNLLREA